MTRHITNPNARIDKLPVLLCQDPVTEETRVAKDPNRATCPECISAFEAEDYPSLQVGCPVIPIKKPE